MARRQHQNRLLQMLPLEESRRLLRRQERIAFPVKTPVYEPGQMIEHAYFPISGVVSSVIVMEDGAAVEAAITGKEGMIGVELIASRMASPYRTVQQVSGESIRVPAGDFQEGLDGSTVLRRVVDRYALALLQQTAQNAACNRRHSVEERMSRWLLASADRMGADEMDITQEFLAEMLGVRRQSVNLTAGLLQQAGLITYRRGRVRILDRAGMARSACECYEATSRIYEELLDLPAAPRT